MKEKEFISIIKNTLNSEYIGDDCAYLKDLGITISQDSLVEGVHFDMNYTTAYQLGYKSVVVNISDICSSGAKPSYLTIGLSLPENTDSKFIEEFYKGCKAACKNGEKIVGGDITGGDKIFVSVCAIGKTFGRNISSRKHAKIGQKVIVSGEHGNSSAGLNLLQNGKNINNKFVQAHLMPEAQIDFGEKIGTIVKEPYAMMDSSDGLMETLSTIANESGVLLEVDFNKIPYNEDIKQFEDWKNLILFGGEDYQLVATVPKDYPYGIEIGEVKSGLGVNLKFDKTEKLYSKQEVDARIYQHF